MAPPRAELGGIVLAGGGSRRMGASKATLGWHGSTLVRRVAGLVGRVADPVIVVAAPGQALPPLPGTARAVDETPGRGPLEGVAAGLRALEGRCDAAFVAATDLPFLHPAFLAAIAAGLGGADASVPEAAGRLHPLAGVYRISALAAAEELLASGERRATSLPGHLMTAVHPAASLPHPESLRNVNTREEYEDALREPEPEVRIGGDRHRAASAGRLRAMLGLPPESALLLAGKPLGDDEDPLADGDTLSVVPPGQARDRSASST